MGTCLITGSIDSCFRHKGIKKQGFYTNAPLQGTFSHNSFFIFEADQILLFICGMLLQMCLDGSCDTTMCAVQACLLSVNHKEFVILNDFLVLGICFYRWLGHPLSGSQCFLFYYMVLFTVWTCKSSVAGRLVSCSHACISATGAITTSGQENIKRQWARYHSPLIFL